ncbi:MAG: low molecular weight protein arginine phosphatase [Clostridia bacterium]|nr:low molecular weight protein arginine phosphatase [Clostridia bacterium]
MNYLFVCTGNTCRSPMAQCLMAHLSGQPCQSAGLGAFPGQSASSGAVHAMNHYKLDLCAHRAQPVTEALLQWADEIWAMTPGHLAALRRAYPQYSAKYHVFVPAIADPYGGDDGVYLKTAQALCQQLLEMAQKP